jgi:hypothetical protein
MTALMVVFLFGSVAASELARRTQPKIPIKGTEAWGLNMIEFKQRQLALRVKVAWSHKFPAFQLNGARVVMTLASDKARFDDRSIVSKSCSTAREWTALARDTNWADIKEAAGCGLGISPATISVEGGSRNPEVRHLVDAVLADLDRFVKQRYGSKLKVKTSSALSEDPHVDLVISFVLDAATSRALAGRFAAGPPHGAERERMWCK